MSETQGITWFRSLNTPRIDGWALGREVIAAVGSTSRTLATLMPNV